MYSMTGYGRGEYKESGVELTVEIKTVNNRYLDASIRCPRIFAAIEEEIRGAVRQKLTRGHADIYISYTDKRDRVREIRFDEAVAKAYVGVAERVRELFPQIKDDISVTNVLKYPDVIRAEEAVADDELIKALFAALEKSLMNLNAMREIEGKKLKTDMLSRMDTIEKFVGEVEVRAPLVAENYRSKLEVKMHKILDSVEIDEQRLLTEVALFADKSNIDEELTRLHSHISQFREICKEPIVGRKLDFLVQEFNRETNTVCSKSNDLEVTRLALALKNEIEKVREQVQNIE